jgi:regulator of protease activity HflC (stomatin/prohibitin superfamily)
MRNLRLIAPFLLFGALTQGCATHSTGETEVGVLVCKFGLGCAHQGVQSVVYPPGSTNFFAPLVRDFYTFDTKVQNLRMSAKNAADGTGEGNDLQFKTTDGSDVSMDVTVVWGIDAQMAPSLLEMVGKDTEEVKEKLVRPMARTIVRDVLNRLDSESIYNADKRFQGAEEAQRQLATALTPYGVLVSQVILHEHRFPPEYEKIIHDRKLAEQRAEQLKSEAEAAQQEALRDLEGARGKAASDLAQAQGALNRTKLEADARYYQSQQESEAIVAERQAKAQAIAKRNEALRGAGGRAMVKLRIAEALQGKQVVLVPGGGGGLQRLDVNKLLEWSLATQEATNAGQ